jgi:predicted component of type VI protein secretion system
MVFITSFLPEEQSQPIPNKASELLDSVRFNLQHLMESEAPLVVAEEHLPAVARSIMHYGIEEIQSLNYQASRQQFVSNLKALISKFEPRIKNLEISFVGSSADKPGSQSLETHAIHFVIEGDLVNGRAFVFNSELDIGDLSVNLESDLD